VIPMLLIVGDRFQAFREENPDVKTFSELIQSPEAAGNNLLVPGQGLSAAEMTAIETMMPPENRESVSSIFAAARSATTHKHFDRNIVIAAPKCIGPRSYTSRLLIDDDCSEMADHNSGRHLQAMVLIEAARQMLISVTEEFLIPPAERGTKYFVFDGLNIKFKAFAFPLPTVLSCRFTCDERKATSARFTAEIEVLQAGSSVTSIAIDYCFFDREAISRREKIASIRATDRALASFRGATNSLLEGHA
jgi:A-factor biosynthesis hotdog domain